MKTVALILTMLFLVACGGSPTQSDTEQPPSWVTDPTSQAFGLAAAECVRDTGNWSIDRDRAQNSARSQIAQIIDVGVEAMETNFSRHTEHTDGFEQGQSFEFVSRQLTDQTLRNVSTERAEYVHFRGQDQLCVLMTVGNDETRQLVHQAMTDAGFQGDPDVAYEEFRAATALDEMDVHLERRRNR